MIMLPGGAFPPKGKMLGAEEFLQTELDPTERKSLTQYPFHRRGDPRVAATKDRWLSRVPCSTPAPDHRGTRGQVTCPQKDGKKGRGRHPALFRATLYMLPVGNGEGAHELRVLLVLALPERSINTGVCAPSHVGA